jgi:hypothetical protein
MIPNSSERALVALLLDNREATLDEIELICWPRRATRKRPAQCTLPTSFAGVG